MPVAHARLVRHDECVRSLLQQSRFRAQINIAWSSFHQRSRVDGPSIRASSGPYQLPSMRASDHGPALGELAKDRWHHRAPSRSTCDLRMMDFLR